MIDYISKLNQLDTDFTEIQNGSEVLDGVILSDGHLCRVYDNYANFDISLSGDMHFDWLQRIKDSLFYMGVQSFSNHPVLSDAISHGMPYKRLRLSTPKSTILSVQQYRWYVNKVKIVPEDFILTPISLANWFMGDGSSTYNNQNEYNGVRVNLSTENFSPHDLDLLEMQLARFSLFDIDRTRCECGGYRLMIKTDYSERFMNIVEPHIVSSFEYKIKRRKYA
jgi:hypothetical protein